MTAFPAFLIYSLTALVIAGFEVQAVLLSRLSLWETILYCTAKVLIALGILYASIQYRIFRKKKMWGYVIVAGLFLSGGSLYSMYNTFSGRLAVSLESGQKQDADLEESASLKSSAEKKDNAAQANTDASQRFAQSTRKGSLWGQINTAKEASRNADESATLASRAADLKRNAGVTEQQVLTLVSPLKPLPSMIVMSAWFAVILELLNLLAAAGAADYIVTCWDAGKASGKGGNVVQMPSPADQRRNRQQGRIQIRDTAAVSESGDSRTQAVSQELYRSPDPSTARIQQGNDADTAAVSRNGPLTDAEYSIFVRALAKGLEPSVRKIMAVYPVGQRKVQDVLSRMDADGLIQRVSGPSGRVLGYKRAGVTA